MIVGVPKEIKSDEYRVAMLPVGALELTQAGHTVLFETGAGQGSGIADAAYESSGATIVSEAAEIWADAELIIKVKEPQPLEWLLLRADQVLLTYFHFAADEPLTRAIIDRLRYLDDIMPPNVTTLYSDRHTIIESIERADLVIGAVLITGARAPRLLKREDVGRMKNGSVIVDVAIDQGGCVATSRPTTHRQPTYLVDGVVHYCVTNMPGPVGRTSTYALCNVS